MMPMYINGQWVEASDGASFEVYDPATEQVIDSVPNGTPDDALKAIAAAKTVFAEWRWVPAVERADMLHEAANKIRAHFDELVRLNTLEEGKPIPEHEEEMDWTLNTLRYYAELGGRL